MKKIFLFFTKILLTIIVVILAKTMFLCWYHDNFTLAYFMSYILDINNALIAIGCITSNLLNSLLSKTLFAISFRDVIKLLFNNNNSTSEGKFSFKHFSKDKLSIGGPDEPLSSNIKSIEPKKGDYLMSENNSEINKDNGGSSNNDLNRNVPELVNFDKLNSLMAESKKLMLDIDNRFKKWKGSSSSLLETSTIKEEIKNSLVKTSTTKTEIKSPLPSDSTDKTINKSLIEVTNPPKMDLDKHFQTLGDLRQIHQDSFDQLLNVHYRILGTNMGDLEKETEPAIKKIHDNFDQRDKIKKTIPVSDPNYLKRVIDLDNNTHKKNITIFNNLEKKMFALVKDHHKEGHIPKELYDLYDKHVRKVWTNTRQNFMAEQNKLVKEIVVFLDNKKK